MHQRGNSGQPISFRGISNKLSEWTSSVATGNTTTNPTEIKEESLSEEWEEMSSLTMSQRLTGFFMSLGMGIVFIIIAISFVPTLALFPKKFAFFYSCGSFFAVISTSFLVGPRKQITMMFESHRAHAAAGYFISFFMTLVAAVSWSSTVLSIAFASCQVVAVLWYSLSFIPFARQVVGTFFSYFWVVAKPVLSFIGSMIASCFGYLCSSSSSGGVTCAV
jgi:hypothetical protein